MLDAHFFLRGRGENGCQVQAGADHRWAYKRQLRNDGITLGREDVGYLLPHYFSLLSFPRLALTIERACPHVILNRPYKH